MQKRRSLRSAHSEGGSWEQVFPNYIHEDGLRERVAIVEFESVERAEAAYGSPEYLAAVRHLRGAAVRDARIIRGLALKVGMRPPEKC